MLTHSKTLACFLVCLAVFIPLHASKNFQASIQSLRKVSKKGQKISTKEANKALQGNNKSSQISFLGKHKKGVIIFSIICLVLFMPIVCIRISSKQEDILFPSPKLEKDTCERLICSKLISEYNFQAEDNTKLHGLLYRKKSSPITKDSRIILFFHGNDKNILGYHNTTSMWNDITEDVFIADYRGYGESEGKILKEEDFYKDITAMYEKVLSLGYQEKNIYLLGYSLGAAGANYIAAQPNYKPAGLITIGAFKSIPGAFPTYESLLYPALRYHLNNACKISKAQCPILIIHGQKDKNIPYSNAKRLFKAAKKGASQQVDLFSYDGGHFSFLSPGEAQDAVKNKIKNFINDTTTSVGT